MQPSYTEKSIRSRNWLKVFHLECAYVFSRILVYDFAEMHLIGCDMEGPFIPYAKTPTGNGPSEDRQSIFKCILTSMFTSDVTDRLRPAKFGEIIWDHHIAPFTRSFFLSVQASLHFKLHAKWSSKCQKWKTEVAWRMTRDSKVLPSGFASRVTRHDSVNKRQFMLHLRSLNVRWFRN
jgi:hypothetical protein